MMKKKDDILHNDPEFGLDARYKSKNERKLEGAQLMEARLKRMKNLSNIQIAHAQLMQLKLKMEAYLENPVYDSRNYFTEFLTQYIDIIYSKRNDFAKDIAVTPVNLSQIINSHREPSDEFIQKLIVHSEKVYADVCHFPKTTWFMIYFHEKVGDKMSRQKEWRPKIEKLVKFNKLEHY